MLLNIRKIVLALRPLNIHILCEKPLSTTLDSCVQMCQALNSKKHEPIIFAIGHVLRYSPHNMLLRKLLCDDKVVGDIVNINHTEPVGWWHFAHSYVR
jgi:predicted dehydrogenase